VPAKLTFSMRASRTYVVTTKVRVGPCVDEPQGPGRKRGSRPVGCRYPVLGGMCRFCVLTARGSWSVLARAASGIAAVRRALLLVVDVDAVAVEPARSETSVTGMSITRAWP